MAETPSGMLNAVGLQNKGVKYFCEHIYPKLLSYQTNILVNVSGSTVEEYIACAEPINELVIASRNQSGWPRKHLDCNDPKQMHAERLHSLAVPAPCSNFKT